jgi:hypothetical protein
LRAVLLLDRNVLIFVAVQGAGGIGLLSQRLDCRHHGGLIGLESRTYRSVVIDVLGHRIEDGWEGHERYEGRIEALLLGSVIQCCAPQVAVLFQPIIGIDDLLGVTGSGANLRKQGIGIERNRREQLFQLFAAGDALGSRHPADQEKTGAPAE